jgi:hypothetical protein
MRIGLFVEDDDSRQIRDFNHHHEYTDLTIKWYRVRTIDRMIEFIGTKGMPNIISFDHDLEPIHYNINTNTIDYTEYPTTGYSCCEFVIEILKRTQLPCTLLVHSMNPLGRDRILELIENYKNM